MDHANQPIVDGDGCTGVARLSADLVDNGSGLVTRPPRHTTRITRRTAEFAGDVAEHWIRADPVDLESLDVVDRLYLVWVELDKIDFSEGAGTRKLTLVGKLDLGGNQTANFERAEPFRFLAPASN